MNYRTALLVLWSIVAGISLVATIKGSIVLGGLTLINSIIHIIFYFKFVQMQKYANQIVIWWIVYLTLTFGWLIFGKY